jgi:hypothetical protein
MTVLIKRVALNVAALGALFLVAVHLGVQPGWADETQAASLPPIGIHEDGRAVIVEHRNALGDRHEVGRTFLGHLLHEFDNRLLGCSIVL